MTDSEKAERMDEVVEQVTSEAVRRGMRSRLREPILKGIEQSGEDVIEVSADALAEEEPEPEGKSRRTKATQGLAVFLVMFAGLYVLMRRLTGRED